VVWARLRLAAELGRWGRAGRRAVLWWRDDDARAPTPALERLLALADRRRTPVTMAVIPDGPREDLRALVAGRPWVSIAQHGADHRNRRDGPAAGEFPSNWTREQIIAAVTSGWSRLAGLPGAQRVFVPPWNDVHPALPEALRDSGYLALSAWGEIGRAGDRLDAHIDLMRWRKGARFRGAARVHAALADALRRRRLAQQWDAPIGLLTHHLDHDPAAWAFLEAFLAWSADRPELVWASLADLLPRRGEARSTAA
jgi:hypothetical protein